MTDARLAFVTTLLALALVAGSGCLQVGGAPPGEDVSPPHYVAVGDSITNLGVTRPDGWVNRYLGTTNVYNGGRDNATSFEVLAEIESDGELAAALDGADRVTLLVGINDLFRARQQYAAGACGGADNEDCLRTMVARFKTSLDAIIRQIRERSECVLLSVGDLYSLAYLEDTLRRYHAAMNAHVHASGEAIAGVAAGFGAGTGVLLRADGVHPNALGDGAIGQAFHLTQPVSRCDDVMSNSGS